MRCGSRDGTFSSRSTIPARAPPLSPVIAARKAPRRRPASTARKTLGLDPLVERASNRSPRPTSASTWRAKTCSNPKSLLAAVSTEVLVVSAMAGMAGRSSRKRTTNSAARCWASAALPPLPNSTSLPPAEIAAPARSASCATRVTSSAEKLCLMRQLSSSCARTRSASSARGAIAARSAPHDLLVVAADAARGVARVHHHLRRIGDRLVIVAGMIGGDHHGVVTCQRFRRQLHRAHLRIIVVPHLVELREVRIVVIHQRAALSQQLHDLQRGRFTQIVYVLLVGYSQHQHARTF